MKYIRASHPKVFISSPQIYVVASSCLGELLVRANGDSAPPPSQAKCLKITEKVSVNIMSYVLSGQKIIKNAKSSFGEFLKSESLKLAVKQDYQTGHF